MGVCIGHRSLYKHNCVTPFLSFSPSQLSLNPVCLPWKPCPSPTISSNLRPCLPSSFPPVHPSLLIYTPHCLKFLFFPRKSASSWNHPSLVVVPKSVTGASHLCLHVGDVPRTCRVRCLKCDGGQEVERRGRYGKIEEDEEWKEMGKWAAEKCRGELGMVEMLECLEKEAVMGKDSGKEPTDYDRRARSKVFLALRDEEEEQHPRPLA